MFRSLDMAYMQVLVPSAVSEDFADQIGRKEIFEFTDLNEELQPFQRPYTSDIMKIQEIERRLRAIEDELDAYGIPFDGAIKPQDMDDFLRPHAAARLVEATSEEVNLSFKNLKEQATAEKQLKAELENQKDAITVLNQIDIFLAQEREARGVLQDAADRQQHDAGYGRVSPNAVPLLNADHLAAAGQVEFRQERPAGDVGFKFLAGVVTVPQRVSFERQVFLTSRGNSFVQFDEETDDERLSFVVFFLGEQLRHSLRRLCQFMNIQVCYESDSEVSRHQLLQDATAKEEDFRRIHHATKNALKREMRKVAAKMKQWKITLLQEKCIRVSLNKFLTQGTMLRAEGWCPVSQKPELEAVLENVVANKGVGRYILTESPPPKGLMPPTAFDLNEFTAVFQQIVDTYGVPRYKEFNPAVPTIVTFPFLFGVMYGDMFHGGCIFLFGCFLLFGGSYFDLRNSDLADMHEARYVLTLMGMFSIYCGLIYNDAISNMVNGWNKTQWTHSYVDDENGYEKVVILQHNVYDVGLDPAWRGVDNALEFTNSLKMKLSVIIGVTQMTFGLFIKAANHIYEEDRISFLWEFVPQFVFMMSFFGYMIFLIVWKWCINWRTTNLPDVPALITTLIKLVLSPGGVNSEAQVFETKWQQQALHGLLLVCMLVSIPCMLFGKPYILKWKHEAAMRRAAAGGHMRLHDDDEDEEAQAPLAIGHSDEAVLESAAADGKVVAHGGGHGDEEEFDFSEVMIHQLIHTIEYVLGTVSNTASYLRLWALSLAHAELSDVFYEKTLKSGFNGSGPIHVVKSVGSVFMFLMFTFAVLLVMDVLECFLHALRLHWVEFQNKFFYADGIAFMPFSYKSTLKEDD